MADSESLYAEIGGRDAVEAAVFDFYDRVFADPQLEPYFEETDREALYAHQVQFVSAVTGSPVSYEGADVGPAHEGLGITGADFDRVATYLDAALEANGVAAGDREAVLEAVAALKPAIDEE